MLPLSLLTTAEGHAIQVELKSGETLNGQLISCDTWMNLTMNNIIQTSFNGEKFFKLSSAYIRGNNIKYLRISDDVLDIVKQNTILQQIEGRANRQQQQGGGGGQQRNNRNGYRNNNINSRGGGYRGGRGGGGGNRMQQDTIRS